MALGGVLAMSSTAIVIKLLSERLELDTAHGRDIVGVLLFQDLAVVPLLILVPALAQAPSLADRGDARRRRSRRRWCCRCWCSWASV